MRQYLLYISLFLVVDVAQSQDSTFVVDPPVDMVETYPIDADSSRINIREYDPEYIKEKQSKSKYNYDLDPEKEDSILGRWFAKFIEFLTPEETPSTETVSNVWTVIKYLFAIAGIGLLVAFIYKSNFKWIFKKKNKTTEEIDIELVDETSSLDELERYILDAESQGQYRFAVRLRFLRMLRILDEAKLIKAATGKTNQAYLYELRNHPNVDQVKEATRTYEYIWYGLFDIGDREEYNTISSSFDFIDHLKKRNQ